MNFLIFHTIFFMETYLLLSISFKGAVMKWNICESVFLHYPAFSDFCHLGIPNKNYENPKS